MCHRIQVSANIQSELESTQQQQTAEDMDGVFKPVINLTELRSQDMNSLLFVHILMLI